MNRICEELGCGRQHHARGLCSYHRQKKRNAEMPRCSLDDCQSRQVARGLCGKHYARKRITGDPHRTKHGGRVLNKELPCDIDGCDRLRYAHQWCRNHWRLWRLYGDPQPRQRREGWQDSHGYWFIRRPGHPNAHADGVIAEHRWVMAESLTRDRGYPLLPGETVHHRDTDRTNNAIDNLEVWTGHHPPGARAADQLAWAREIIARYEGTVVDPQVSSEPTLISSSLASSSTTAPARKCLKASA